EPELPEPEPEPPDPDPLPMCGQFLCAPGMPRPGGCAGVVWVCVCCVAVVPLAPLGAAAAPAMPTIAPPTASTPATTAALIQLRSITRCEPPDSVGRTPTIVRAQAERSPRGA